MKLVQQKKFILVTSVTTVLFLVWLLAIQLPLRHQYVQVYSQLSTLEKSNSEIGSLETKVRLLQARKDKSVESYLDLLKRISSREQYLAAIGTIKALAREHNLEVEMFEPSAIPIELKSNVAPSVMKNIVIEKRPTDVTLRGDYLDFGYFLDDFERIPHLFAVENIIIEPTSSKDALTFSMVIYTYLKREEA